MVISKSDDIVRVLDAYIAALFLYCFVWKFHLLSVGHILTNISSEPSEIRSIYPSSYKMYRHRQRSHKFVESNSRLIP